MSVYRATVGQDFLTMIQPKIDGDTRGKEVAKRQWSFEFIEYALGKIPASGHTWYDGIDHDTEHDYFGKCDLDIQIQNLHCSLEHKINPKDL